MQAKAFLSLRSHFPPLEGLPIYDISLSLAWLGFALHCITTQYLSLSLFLSRMRAEEHEEERCVWTKFDSGIGGEFSKIEVFLKVS